MSESAAGRPGALAGRRVVELACERTARAARLLGELGATVTRLEAPGRPRELVAAADLLLCGVGEEELAALGLDSAWIERAAPRLVVTCITGFGTSGPHAGWRSSDLVASAVGGAMHVTGWPEDPPVVLAGEQALVAAGAVAVAASLAALREADASGRGQRIDVSLEEVVASVSHICGIAKWRDDGIVPRRAGTSLFASVPSGTQRCRDGLVYLMVNRPAHWEALAAWVHEVTGNREVLDPMFRGPSSVRIPHRELLDLFLAELFERLTVEEVEREAAARHLAITPVRGLDAVCADPHLAARGFFVEGRLPDGRPCRRPGPPCRVAGSPAAPRRAPTRAPDGRGALAGLRVLEITAGMAGPWIGRYMAYCGADVLRIESVKRPDVVRLYVPPRDPHRGCDPQGSPWFTDWNAGKRFVALDLETPGAVAIVKRLVARCDAVVENMSTGVLDKLGLGYAALRAHRPDLVMLSSTGYGATGPSAARPTWGPNIEALSGLATLSGFPHREATITQYAYPDALSALNGLVALLAALERRDRSARDGAPGEGQWIDLAQLETMVASLAPLVGERALTGREPVARGNDSPTRYPHGVYRCAGDDAWCAIDVQDGDDWAALARVVGRPEWAADPGFASVDARRARRAEIDGAIEAWTGKRDPTGAMEELQATGLAAGAVRDVAALAADPHLIARGFFEEIPQRRGGSVVATGIPMRFSRSRTGTPDTGAAVGADTRAVLREVAGLTDAEIDAAIAEGAVEVADPHAPCSREHDRTVPT